MATKKIDPERLARLRTMVTTGTLCGLRVANMGQKAHWYVIWAYEDSGIIHVEDVTIRVARTIGYRFSEKHYWLVADAFDVDGSCISNRIREALDMPDFEWKVVK